MSVQASTFGSRIAAAAKAPKSAREQLMGNTAQTDDFVKAEYWLNIGYVVTIPVMDKETNELVEQEKFISFPKGIALDNLSDLDTGNGDGFFAQLQFARMNLQKEMLAKAQTLAPGQTAWIEDHETGEPAEFGGLRLQLRRVKGDVAPIKNDENPLIRKLPIFG